ncbi:restriction endonuclease [Geitlerinema sp. PCC 7407]|uniref:restriction endonuclease n=1 Tax=Geitlerinema sp. PCC 7407 TaxID=1173025 RepID=UPI00029FAF91|nr:restriction endonuclease [Geitlerinema sp. PCC 7407]AFY67142.1 restriction endonuclease [Geitlerinema sp. PCC 7407]
MTSDPMSFADAAFRILQSAGEPLHYQEITRRSLEQGFLQTDGKTPDATLNARLAVDIKQKGEQSPFVRIRPGVFGLRIWGLDPFMPNQKPSATNSENQRVRTPLFPIYSEVRLVLPIWQGHLRAQITGLRSTLSALWGSPQAPVDWTDPDVWIPQRLQGSDRELAEAIWKKTDGKVNPRHVYGHWLLACQYGLLAENAAGPMLLTDRGNDFVTQEQGDAVAYIDEHEGLLKILTIVAEKGTGRHSDFVPEWAEYLQRYSRFGTDGTIKDTLWCRLRNLLERGFLSRTGTTYSITDAGLAYLRRTGGSEDTDSPDELQEILTLVKQQSVSIRAKIRDHLEAMDPIAFEHLIKQLLEAMNYQNVMVTAPSNDKGIDVKADIEMGITSVREVVQAKRQKGNIQRPVLDALRGSLHRFDAVRGTIITVGDFSKGTAAAAVERGAAPITLINGEKLIDLLIEHKIGVRTRSVEILELDPDMFKFTELKSKEEEEFVGS